MKNLILILSLCTAISCTDNSPELIPEKPQTQSNDGLNEFKSLLAAHIIESDIFNNNRIVDKQAPESDICNSDDSGCTSFIYSIPAQTVFLDISSCVMPNTTFQNCWITGTITMYLCDRGDENWEVIFEESDVLSFNHSQCMQNPPALINWDCINQLLGENIINAGMPAVMDLWGGNADCLNGYQTFTSIYKREKCTIPCLTNLDGYSVVEFKQCGESSACCIKKQYWCTLPNGQYNVDDTEYYQIGQCSQGKPRGCSRDGFNFINRCEPRSCFQPL